MKGEGGKGVRIVRRMWRMREIRRVEVKGGVGGWRVGRVRIVFQDRIG